MSVRFDNINATTAAFNLAPASYSLMYSGTWGAGTVTLQRLASDGTTWLNALPAWNINSVDTKDLAGTFRLLVAGGATAVYASISALAIY
jgi:hypothetical protein